MKNLNKLDLLIETAVCSSLLLLPISTAFSAEGDISNNGNSVTIEDTINWWQWALAIPSSVHPLSLKPQTDPTGKYYCMVGQHGSTWNLGGQFKVVDPIPDEVVTATTNETDAIAPFVVERECRVPLGQEILIPVLNVECSTAEEILLNNLDPDATLAEKASYLLDGCATLIADEITETEAQFGLQGSELQELKVKRVATKVPFQVTFSPDNILSDEDFFINPDPNPSLAQADGYWVKVKPKKPGTYVLHTYGVAPAFDFALDITYTLEVALEGPGALFEEASE